MDSSDSSSIDWSFLSPSSFTSSTTSRYTSAQSTRFNSADNSTFSSARSSATSLGVMEEGFNDMLHNAAADLFNDIHGDTMSEISDVDVPQGNETGEEGVRGPPASRDERTR
ncbi:hypothetical protein I203_100130 [Kwoniella mangroviensis CBS 8507]|uniref:uncharacterized protein n=1 Tax=Kwoniella mangroviensis CBS 8507 TaxID=1296122 RepID=UPI00306B20E3